MSGPANLRWLPALALFVAIPAALQATGASYAFPPETGAGVGAETGSLDLPTSTSDVMPQPQQLTPEELGDLHEVRGRYRAAVAAYAKVEQPSAAVWNKMGIAYQMFFAWEDALRCYKQAHRLAPRDSRILNNLATVYEAQRRFPEAEDSFRRALKLNPRDPIVLKNLGTNQLMQHKHTEGAKAYRDALALDLHIFEPREGPRMDDPAPPNERGTANYFTAQSCARVGLNDCALTHLRKAINEGAATRQRIAEDHAFDALRETPMLQKLLTISDE